MAVLTLPSRKPIGFDRTLDRLCLQYVNWSAHWFARNSRLRSLTMELSLDEPLKPAPTPAPRLEPGPLGLSLVEMGPCGSIRSLLSLYNRAYQGAPDYRRAGWVHSRALRASNGFDPSLVWTAYLNGDPAGFCMARLYGECGRITGIGVLPGLRRRGIGTALMNHAVEELRHRGAMSVGLHVCDTNVPSIRVYRRLGFREV